MGLVEGAGCQEAGGGEDCRVPPDASPFPAFPGLAPAPHRALCTDCGLSRTALAKRCGQACQFLRPDYPALEARVHGRARDPARPDELHFGPFRAMYRAALREPRPGAQWTGIASRLGERLLETGAVTAVLAMAADPEDRWKPVPMLVTRPEEMAACRGMKMGFAPLLALIEPAARAGHRRIGVIGIPCQVHALRAIEAEFGLERLYVIGTPCSDNTSTAMFHRFLDLLDPEPSSITYLEFRADFHVELRHADGRVRTIPFLQLPISRLPADFFPLTCRTCVDYTNVLADITVGYMGGEGRQWLLVRNARGQELLDLLAPELELAAPGSRGSRRGAVKGFIANTVRAAGGLPLRRMPDFLRPLMGWLMPRIGPRGLEFARARVEMKAAETVLFLRHQAPRRLRSMVPARLWEIVAPYGITPRAGEAASKAATKPGADAA
jgi:coenzyme F420 hydrogenase subunit beta